MTKFKRPTHNEDYWDARAVWVEKNAMKNVDKINKTIQDGYKDVLKDIEKDIASFITKNSTVLDLNKPVSYLQFKDEMEYYWGQYNKFMASGDFGDEISAMRMKRRIDSLNVRRNRTRLEVFKTEIQAKLDMQTLKASGAMSGALKGVYTDSHSRSMFTTARGTGFGFLYNSPTGEMIEKALTFPWSPDGSLWSENIWDYAEQQAEQFTKAVRRTIASDIIAQGKNPSTVAKNIVGFGNPKLSKSTIRHNSARLLYTESTHVIEEAKADVSELWGFKEYRFSAILDGATSRICKSWDGEICEYKERQAGMNFPPMHPWCRSLAVAVVPDDLDLDSMAVFKPVELPDTMTYNQFKRWQDTGEIPKALKVAKEKMFKDAKTIKEANEYAMKELGVPLANYKGHDVRTANEWNRGLQDNFERFPELKNRFGFVGDCRERNKVIFPLWEEELREHYAGSFTGFGAEEAIERTVKKQMAKFKRRFSVSKDTMAQSFSPTTGVLKPTAGITVNRDHGKDFVAFTQTHVDGVASKFHPEGAVTIRASLDHEIGHQLDDMLGIGKIKEIQELYDSRTAKELTNDLSTYSHRHGNSNRYSEMIAEGWSEYTNNPNPREMARVIGETIEFEYDKKFGKVTK